MSGRGAGLFAGDASMALEASDTRDFDGTLSPQAVVSQFAVAALYERRPAVVVRRYKNQTETTPKTAPSEFKSQCDIIAWYETCGAFWQLKSTTVRSGAAFGMVSLQGAVFPPVQ